MAEQNYDKITKMCVSALIAKKDYYDTLEKYYDGDHVLRFSTERLKKVFKKTQVKFVENWMGVVVDAVMDKLSFGGYDSESKTENEKLDSIFQEQGLAIEEEDIHRYALITGESFVIVGEDEGKVEIYYNDPRMCHMFYDPAHPKRKMMACKVWVDGTIRMNVYMTNRVLHFKTDAKELKDDMTFDLIDEEAYQDDRGMPVFHFKTGRTPESALSFSAITIQDAVNKLFSDMMVAAEFGAFKQRWIIGNADITDLENAPWKIWGVPAGQAGEGATQVGEFQETDLENYMSPMEMLSQSIAIITRTPKHYFLQTGANVSGESLLAMEGPLNKKVERYRKSFESTWLELARYLIGQDDLELTAVWKPIESVQPLTEMEIVKTATTAGIPLVTALRWAGKSESEIQLMLKEKEEEQARNSTLMQDMLDLKRNQGL